SDNVSTSNYTDTGLTNGTTYYYVVTAVDVGTNESDLSSEVSATPVDVPPAAPTGLGATPGNTTAELGWNDNLEADLDSYNVYRSLTSGSGYSQISDNVSTSAYTDTGLTNGTTYYYVVTAVDLGSNESDQSDEASATPVDPPPAAPTGLGATPGNTTVDLNWNDNLEGDLDSYNVYRSLTSDSVYSKISDNVSTSDYTDTGLTNGTTYYYVVTAVDLGSNESDYSNEASATPYAPQTLLDDSFEGSPWDANWDGNGTTTWILDSGKAHTGTYNARLSNTQTAGSLTSDDLNAAGASWITVNFWFNPKGLEAGDIIVKIYNGSTYNTWYDLTSYPTYTNNVWCSFSETITDSQYLISNFRLQFDGSVLGDSTEEINIDDVLVTTNQ
ncbi:MAG TPA: fibronectin type III domain-containing protein, partial [Dehalococcoidales bacterium]|nr:fibronectin type III domain-containing protein [Dehalococcoidales bacterium]